MHDIPHDPLNDPETATVDVPPENKWTEEPTFPTWLRRSRVSRGMTQDMLANTINQNGGTVINGSVISHWESGARRPNGANLLAMCLSLDVGIVEAQRALSVPLKTDLTGDNQAG